MPQFNRKTTAAEYEAIFGPKPEPTPLVAVRDGTLAPSALASGLVSMAKAAPRVALQGLTAAHAAIEAIAFAPVMLGSHVLHVRRTARDTATQKALQTLGIPADQWMAMREKSLFNAFEVECRATWSRNRRLLKRLTGEDVGSMPADYAAGKWQLITASRKPVAVTATLADALAAVEPAGPLAPETQIAETVAAIIASGAHTPTPAQETSAAAIEAPAVQLATPGDTTQSAAADVPVVAALGDGAVLVTDVPADIVAKVAETLPEHVAVVAVPLVTGGQLTEPLRLTFVGDGTQVDDAAIAHAAGEAAAIVEAAQLAVGSVAETVAQATVAEVEPMQQQASNLPDMDPAKVAAQSLICEAGKAFLDKPSTPAAAEWRKVTKAAWKAGHATAEQFAKVKAETAPYVQQTRGKKGGK